MKRQRFIILNKTELQGAFVNGAHLVGNVECTLNELRATLGKKFTRNDSDKTSVRYEIMLDDFTTFSIYDYKYYGRTSLYYNPDETITWSIGGNNEITGAKAKLFIEQLLAEHRRNNR